jgi:tetratricopeptide (TPR) repeat protein
MRLDLELPETAVRDRANAQATIDDTVVTWSGLVALPDDRARWIQRVLREGLSPAAAVQLVDDSLDRTRTGWPFRCVTTRVDRGWRLHAFFAFFEHAAFARIEGPSREAVEAQRPLLRTGAPRFELGVAALADLWDIPVGASPPHSDDALAPSIVDTATSHHLQGLAHARAGRTQEAIAAWEAAAAADPLHTDSLYNAGIAHHDRGELEAALACWQRGLARAPRDFWFLRKIVQAQTALGRYAEAGETRRRLLETWSTSSDLAVQRARSYVFVQSIHEGHAIHGSEVLGAGDGTPLLFFEPAHDHGHDHGDRVRVHVVPATGGGARIELERGDARTVLTHLAQRPPLPELLRLVHAWLHDTE